MCYAGALQLVGGLYSRDELVEQLHRDQLLHHISGGGVTLSGGEPALQPEFSGQVLLSLKRLGHHTAIETAGNVPWADLAVLLEHTDLVLFDVKHHNDEVHREVTGAGNEVILANLSRTAELAARGSIEFVARLPIIPGVNDSREDIDGIAALLVPLPGLSGVQLLPYHGLGAPKYAALGRSYTLQNQPSSERGRLAEIATFLRLRGLRVSIEGMS